MGNGEWGTCTEQSRNMGNCVISVLPRVPASPRLPHPPHPPLTTMVHHV
ncbi:MAG: hypothetical protein KME21_08080 [Desmonostoc vinosum HA7617-LM4]|nr:hypothetical protein [Desmonostoc vinosum HA7617-LM4]